MIVWGVLSIQGNGLYILACGILKVPNILRLGNCGSLRTNLIHNQMYK
jgi:hypothetical protein